MSAAVAPMGDTAALVSCGSVAAARGLAAGIRSAVEAGAAWTEAVDDVVPGADSVLLVVDPWRAEATEVAREAVDRLPDAGAHRTTGEPPPRHHVVAVAFDGEDLAGVAATAGCDVDDVAGMLAAHQLEVAFVGFLPGFAYLDGLAPELAAVPRRPQPRTRVPPGSLALAGGYAGIYPLGSPGGWQLVGRTEATLLDLSGPPYAVLAPGDTVRLLPVPEVGDPPVPSRPPLAAAGRRAVVVDPGPESTVQDAGRAGVAAYGIPRAGPADPVSFALANAVVGNPLGAAAIEVTYSGPSLRFEAESMVALVGDAALRIGGHEMPPCTVEAVPAGAVVSVGGVGSGARAYLAVAGGFEPAPLFGSRAGDTMSGLGYGRLRAGDQLAIGTSGRPRGSCRAPVPSARPAVLRVVPGPGPASATEALLDGPFEVDPASNRAGARLVPLAPRLSRGGPSRVPSLGMVAGAVQLPPDGRPIVLGPDHGTIGGYAVAGVVASADLPVLGQLRPGDEVRFEAVDLATARKAAGEQRRCLATSLIGWYPASPA